jgi:inner membrane protein
MESVVKTAWEKSKLLVKGLIIGAIALLLLIPAYFVKEIVIEREKRQEEVYKEVSSKWASDQTVTGPILTIPYTEVADVIKENKAQQYRITKYLYLLPDNLQVNSVAVPEKRKRGIFQVMLYSADMELKGSFDLKQIDALRIDPGLIHWNDAYLSIGLTDLSGLQNPPLLNWKDTGINLKSSTPEGSFLKETLVAPVSIAANEKASFSTRLEVNGSRTLQFVPVGNETTVKMRSAWPDPSFTGAILPKHDITDSGFVANWKALAHTRSFPQAWTQATYHKLEASAFGVDLHIPVNGYQKTLRSVKYALLCIILTFAGFFLIETNNKKSVHPFHYGLIGVALILFYTLLLSFTEYIGFNAAYLLASVAVIGLIAWFVKSLLALSRPAILVGIILVLVYSYVFTTLQLNDYSLILGSVGLFLALAVMMKFSKKIQW